MEVCMKKILFLLALTTFLSGNAYAKHDCNCEKYCAKMEHKMMKNYGGFVDASIKPMSVAEVKKLSDDAYVTLSGYLTKRLSDDEYDFTDGTNNLIVEIDDKVWMGQTVSPKDKILITGKVDKEFTHLKLDVKSLQLDN